MKRVLLVNYDNGNHIPQPPHALAYLAAALVRARHDVEVWDAAITHNPPEALTRYIDASHPDVVAISAIGGYWQYRQLLKLGAAVNASERRYQFWFVIGGHGPASTPHYFREKVGADTVWVGEGEEKFPRLCGRTRDMNPETVYNAPLSNIDSLPWPRWDLFDINVYRLQRYPCVETTEFAMPVLSGRGCTHACSFCYRMTPGYRPRDVRQVAEEIEWLKRDYGIGFINFDDELAMVGRQRTLDLCEAVKPIGVGWMCNGRLDIAARFPELLPEMKSAGCRFINYGVESLSQPVLDEMNKKLTVEQVEKGIQATIDMGIHPGLNVMWGCPNDSLETLRKLVDFLKRRDTHAQVRTIRPVTPYPGSPLFRRAVKEGKIKDEAEFYERLHINSDLASVQWTGLSNDDFHQELYHANCELVTRGMGVKAHNMCTELGDLYLGNNTSWRGFRHG